MRHSQGWRKRRKGGAIIARCRLEVMHAVLPTI